MKKIETTITAANLAADYKISTNNKLAATKDAGKCLSLEFLKFLSSHLLLTRVTVSLEAILDILFNLLLNLSKIYKLLC